MPQTLPHLRQTNHRLPPGPPGGWLFGTTRALRNQGVHTSTLEHAQRCGDIFAYRLVRWPIYAINHPDYVKDVLHGNHRNDGKNFFLYHGFGLVVRECLRAL